MMLFQPILAGKLVLKNRIVMPAMNFKLGLTTPQAIGFYRERALGGAGMLITGSIRVDYLLSDEAWGRPGALQACLRDLPRLVEAVHEGGADLCAQIYQSANYPSVVGNSWEAGEPVGPSSREGRRGLTNMEIQAVIDKHVLAAARARESGFDAVEIHGTHAGLLREFFSPRFNHRQDEYGGSLQGRMRLGLDIVRAVRREIGPDYPLFFRMASEEVAPGGITLGDAGLFARELESAGVDVLDVSVAKEESRLFSPPRTAPMGTFVPQAAAIKALVKVPVVAVGRINTPDVAEGILAAHKADLVAIGRQLLADPFWPRKVQDGRFGEIVVCDSCNINCQASSLRRRLPPGAPLCKKNPRLGHEHEVAVSHSIVPEEVCQP